MNEKIRELEEQIKQLKERLETDLSDRAKQQVQDRIHSLEDALRIYTK